MARNSQAARGPGATRIVALLLVCLFSMRAGAQESFSSTPTGSPQARATLNIASVNAARPTPDDLNLTIRIAASRSAQIDHNDVLVQVFFYDLIAGGTRVAVTDLKPSYDWLTKPPDWSTSEPEVLAVSRITSKRRKRAQPAPPLAGYAIRLYHRGRLQHAVAAPARLLTLFPPPPRQPVRKALR